MENKLSLAANRQLWQERYEDFKRSGLTQAEYCRQHGLASRALCYWVGKFKSQQEPGQQQWATLTVSDAPASGVHNNHQQMTIQIDKIQLRIPSGFDQETIACVIGLLRD